MERITLVHEDGEDHSDERREVHQTLSELESEAVEMIISLSNVESNFAVACSNLGGLIDAVQNSIMLAQDKLEMDDTVGQSALKKLISCAEQLYRTSQHIRNLARNLATITDLLRQISQTFTLAKSGDATALALVSNLSSGADGFQHPVNMDASMCQLKGLAEQLASGDTVLPMNQVGASFQALREVLERLIKPATQDLHDIDFWLQQLLEQDSIVKQHLKGSDT